MSRIARNSLIFVLLVVTSLMGWLIWHHPDDSPLDGISERWDLQQYELVGQPIRINGIRSNLSGLTYHADSDTLFAVTNKPRKVHVLSKQGELLRTIELSGFRDTESIAHIKDNLFVIAEEQRYNLVLVEINDDTTVLHHSNSTVINIAEKDKRNAGIEGVAFMDQFGLIAAIENPPTIWQGPVDTDNGRQDFSEIQEIQLNVRDFAGISSLPGETDKLLILSESSDSLHVIDMQGREFSRLSLRRGNLGLTAWLRQPEGVAVDNDRRIYVVGEPNQFMILQPRQ
ncbi:MAG: SdiA-regulated domain-containing protein [Methylophaga sp.]|nr:SdiA-regulated domain-containing protein [Methylophaga sp.]